MLLKNRNITAYLMCVSWWVDGSKERLMSRDLPTASVWLQTTPIPSLIKRLEKTFEAGRLRCVFGLK